MKIHLITTIVSILALFSINALASFNSLSVGEVKTLIIEQANEQHVAPALALAIAKVESDFNPLATSSAGARGIMQIMPKTAEDVFGVSRERLYHPQTNITLGIGFIKQLLGRYDQRLDIALSHYNGGSAVQGENGNLHVIPSTQAYVDKVLSYYRKFDITPYYSPFHNNQGIQRANQYTYKVGEVHNQIKNELKANREEQATSKILANSNKGIAIKGPKARKASEPVSYAGNSTVLVNAYPQEYTRQAQYISQQGQSLGDVDRRFNTVNSWDNSEYIKPVTQTKRRRVSAKREVNENNQESFHEEHHENKIVSNYLRNKTDNHRENQVRQWESIFK